MSIVDNETFGEVEFEQRELNSDGEATFSRRDLAPYVEFIQNLATKGKGVEAKVTVVTGEIKRDSKQFRGRGTAELRDAKAFQEAANSLGFGLRISARHLTGNPPKTLLRMMLVNKRTFTDEQNANRERGQNKRRLELAKARIVKANATLAGKPDDVDAKAMLTEATNRVAELQKILSAPVKAPGSTKKQG